MAGRRGLPDGAYYALAVLLSLLTVPMYRYMLQHAGPDRPRVAMLASSPSPVYVVQTVRSVPQRYPLRPGQLCEAGYVVFKVGNVYTQGIDADGHPFRCAGGYLIDPQ